MFTKATLASALLAVAANAGNAQEWKERSIYQVLTDRFARSDGSTYACNNLSNYCGGDYQGMINNLDYVQGMGFDAIWITPIVDNVDGGYHGYWARNWEEVNSNFGSKDDLKALVDACHERDIWVMVDVVANHVGPIGSDFNQIYPLNQSYHYHTDCQISNWNDQAQVEYCRLADLPDLDQDNDFVRSYLKSWVGGIVQEYGFDGIRIDTIPEVSKDFWREYGEASGVFQMGECFNGDPAYVGPYQDYVTALFNYPMYYTIGDVFGSGASMYGIRNRYSAEEGKFKDIDVLGVFVDNHDNARFMSKYNNYIGLRSAVTFALTSRGIPFTYYGTEQSFNGGNDPKNRESLWQDMDTNSDLYKQIGAIHAQRKTSQIWTHDLVERYVDEHFYAFSRGEFLVALTNQPGTKQNRQITYHPFSDGEVVCDIFYPTTDCQTVNGFVDVWLVGGESKIYVPQSQLSATLLEQAQEFLQ